ncbi:hypothetical protein [Candidatus Nitrospira bockiana]
MLRYLHTPDEVFQDIMQEALEWMVEDLREYKEDRRAYQELLPRASSFLDALTALHTLEQLKLAHEVKGDVYQLAPIHFVLLADTLKRYCDLYNTRPEASTVHDKYELQQVDGESLRQTFFGDMGVEGSPGGRLTPEDLQLHLIDDPSSRAVIRLDLSPWYRPGVLTYPATAGTA